MTLNEPFLMNSRLKYHSLVLSDVLLHMFLLCLNLTLGIKTAGDNSSDALRQTRTFVNERRQTPRYEPFFAELLTGIKLGSL